MTTTSTYDERLAFRRKLWDDFYAAERTRQAVEKGSPKWHAATKQMDAIAATLAEPNG